MSKNTILTAITYKELGDYIGKKVNVLVSKDWLDQVKESTDLKKECSKCNKSLSLNQFNNDKRRQFGKRSQCKSCYKEANSALTKPIEDVPKIEYVLTDFNA